MEKTGFKTIDEYIRSFPDKDQEVMQKIRHTILNAAPKAKEVISYQMPTFRQNGILVHFAAFSNHYSLFPTPSAVVAFSDDLTGYETSKGTVKFPKDNPIPYDLIAKIVRFKVQENAEKKSKKNNSKS